MLWPRRVTVPSRVRQPPKAAQHHVLLPFSRLPLPQAYTSKPTSHHRNSLRPATATSRTFSASPAGSGPSSPASAASRMRPGSSRPGINTSAAAVAATYGGGGSGGGGMTSPRSPAAGGGTAAARSSRLMSAQANAAAYGAQRGGNQHQHLFAHAKQGPGAAAGNSGVDEGPAGAGPGPGGETTLRLRTGASPAVTSSGNSAYSNGGDPQQQQLVAVVVPAVPRLRLGGQRQRLAEVLVSEGLARALAELRGVAGMEPFAQFAAAGRLLGRLRQSDLGAPLREEQVRRRGRGEQYGCLFQPTTGDRLGRLACGCLLDLLQLAYMPLHRFTRVSPHVLHTLTPPPPLPAPRAALPGVRLQRHSGSGRAARAGHGGRGAAVRPGRHAAAGERRGHMWQAEGGCAFLPGRTVALQPSASVCVF